METSTQRVSLGLKNAKKRSRVRQTIRLEKASRSAPRGGVPGGEAEPDGLVQHCEWSSDEVGIDDGGTEYWELGHVILTMGQRVR